MSKGKEKKFLRKIFRKILIAFALIIALYFGAIYFLQVQQTETSKTNETGIDQVQKIENQKEDFIYQSLLKNQAQIDELKGQIEQFRNDIAKFQNRGKIGKIIFSYVDLRQKIFAKNPSLPDSLKNFEMLIALDNDKLKKALNKLKPLLDNFYNQTELSEEFDNLIPELVTVRDVSQDSFVDKIRYNISKLVVIRRVDEKDTGEIDVEIFKVEKLLAEQSYQEALDILRGLDSSYQDILANFIAKLDVALQVQKIDQEILSYLKNIS